MRAYGPAQSDLQAHAVCTGVAALENGANIRAWQENPFFDYIPWQATSAALGDEPSTWIPLVKQLTGVDLSTLSGAGFATACTGLGGTYYKADTPASVTSALETAISTPLQSQITTLQAAKAAKRRRPREYRGGAPGACRPPADAHPERQAGRGDDHRRRRNAGHGDHEAGVAHAFRHSPQDARSAGRCTAHPQAQASDPGLAGLARERSKGQI